MRKPKRFCRICGKPEKLYAFGYSNISPYSEICVDCINRHVMKTGTYPRPVKNERTKT